jgi:hypothetical protein
MNLKVPLLPLQGLFGSLLFRSLREEKVLRASGIALKLVKTVD